MHHLLVVIIFIDILLSDVLVILSKFWLLDRVHWLVQLCLGLRRYFLLFRHLIFLLHDNLIYTLALALLRTSLFDLHKSCK